MSTRKMVWSKTAGVLGIISPIVAFTCILLAINYYPQFSWTENALSDLGVQEGATAVLFNSGLIVSGVLALVFATGLFLFLNKTLTKIGASIFFLTAAALIAIGVFPENAEPMHYYASVTFFLLAPISLLVFTAHFLLMRKVRMGLFTFLVATISAAIWILYFAIQFVSGVAIPETVSALAASTWVIVLGCKMAKQVQS